MIAVHSVSQPGGHLVNEDAFAVRQHPADPGCWLCVLTDGVGGQPGGGRAAELACRTALNSALGFPPERIADPLAWPSILRMADEALATDAEAGLCTLLGFCIAGGHLFGASAGDSAVLCHPGDAPAREVTAGQHKNPPVGSGAAVFMSFTAPLATGWTVLAMSDGVWKYAGWERIIEAATSLRGQALVDALLERARRGGKLWDDFTLVVFHEAEPRSG